MREIIIGNRYALAIYEIAETANKVDEIYRELKIIMETYETNVEFKSFMNHPLIKAETKKSFIDKLFSSNFQEETINFIQYLIDKKRIDQIKAIVVEYMKDYYDKNHILVAEAIFAVAPTEEQLKNLAAKLNAKENKEIRLKTRIDKSILGGVIVKFGDKIIDASIKREIEAFRNNLQF